MSALTLATAAMVALAGLGAPDAVVPAAAPLTSTTSRPPIIITASSAPVTEVSDPFAKDQIPASESPSAETPVPSATRRLSGAPSPTSAPATGSPVRISAIHIDPPVRVTRTTVTETTRAPAATVTQTETVTVAPAGDEENVVSDAKTHREVEAGPVCVAPKGNYDGVKPYVGIIGAHIQQKFGVRNVAGKAGRQNVSEHPVGLALDFMTNTGNVDGDAIRDYLLDHADDFSIKYVIWQQTLFLPGQSPRKMEDRGSDTANHRDHVHVSMSEEPGPVTPTC